jgi:predicted branched-subunit amino acid permease
VADRAVNEQTVAPAGIDVVEAPSWGVLFRRGFLGLLPLWVGAIPIGIAYGVAARAAGFSLFETQLMSVIVFSASAQISALSLLGAGAPVLVIIVTALALNAQLLLIGLAVGRQERPPWLARLLTACVLTDAAYGVALADGRARLPVLVGAGVSMLVGWNLGTALGALVGAALPDPRRLGVDRVVTLTFLGILVPLIRTRAALLTALAAGVTTLLLLSIAPSVAVLGAGIVGGGVGAWCSRRPAPGA